MTATGAIAGGVAGANVLSIVGFGAAGVKAGKSAEQLEYSVQC